MTIALFIKQNKYVLIIILYVYYIFYQVFSYWVFDHMLYSISFIIKWLQNNIKFKQLMFLTQTQVNIRYNYPVNRLFLLNFVIFIDFFVIMILCSFSVCLFFRSFLLLMLIVLANFFTFLNSTDSLLDLLRNTVLISRHLIYSMILSYLTSNSFIDYF